MNKKLAVAIVLLLILSGVAIYIMRKMPSFYSEEMMLPTLFANIEAFRVNDGLTIVRKDGIWCSQDDDYYPVNNVMVDDFIVALQNAALHVEQNSNVIEGNNKIELLLSGGDKISLFFDGDNGRTDRFMVLSNNKSDMLRGDFVVPVQPYQWFVQPLIKFNDSDIEEISGVEPHDFSFRDLIFYQVTQKNDFEAWASKNIRIEMRNGIIIKFTILTKNHSYWLNMVLDTSVMPTVDAFDFVKNNGFLYDGWFFELPQPVGSRLFGLE